MRKLLQKFCNFPYSENRLKMNNVNDCETGIRDLVASIKKSETIDLMDYTDSGVQGVNVTLKAMLVCLYLTKTMLRASP